MNDSQDNNHMFRLRDFHTQIYEHNNAIKQDSIPI